MIATLRQVLAMHRPAGNAEMFTCTCGRLPEQAVDGTDNAAMEQVALSWEHHVAVHLAAAMSSELTAKAAAAPGLSDVSQMRPDSAFAEAAATGAPVQVTMVNPADCALFVIVGMDGIVNAQAIGLPQTDAGAILRYLAGRWDPDQIGDVPITTRPAVPPTRPNGDPL